MILYVDVEVITNNTVYCIVRVLVHVVLCTLCRSSTSSLTASSASLRSGAHRPPRLRQSSSLNASVLAAIGRLRRCPLSSRRQSLEAGSLDIASQTAACPSAQLYTAHDRSCVFPISNRSLLSGGTPPFIVTHTNSPHTSRLNVLLPFRGKRTQRTAPILYMRRGAASIMICICKVS